MRFRSLSLLINVLFLVFLFISQPCSQKIRYSAELNHIPLGCRAVSMGNTGVTLPFCSYNSYWNPSLASFAKNNKLWFEGAKLYKGLSDLGSAFLSVPIENGLNIGLIYTTFRSGDITEYDTLEGTFQERLYNYELRPDENSGTGVFQNNHNQIILTLAKCFSIPLPRPNEYSTPLPVDFASGINFKYYWQTLDPDDKVRMGMNVNVDIGIAFSVGVGYDIEHKKIDRRVLMSAAVQNVLPTYMIWLHSYEQYKEPVDAVRRYGMAYIDDTGFLKAKWTVSMSLQRRYETTAQAGIEGVFWEKFALRGGVSDGNPAFGAGINTGIFFIDYTMTFDELNITPIRIDVGFEF